MNFFSLTFRQQLQFKVVPLNKKKKNLTAKKTLIVITF